MATEIELGMEAKDTITGFSGLVIGKYEYLYGCTHFLIQPKVDKKGKLAKGQNLEEPQLTVSNPEKVSLPVYVSPNDLIKLGVTARDQLTGIEGIVMARFIFIDGTVKYAIQPEIKDDDDNNFPEDYVMSGAHIVVVKDGRVVEPPGLANIKEKKKDPPHGPSRYKP